MNNSTQTRTEGLSGPAPLTIGPLESAVDGCYAEPVRSYFAHYGLTAGDGCEHVFGTFDSGPFTLAGHLFRPADCQGTVVLLHGYLNHSGQMQHLVRYLTARGLAAAVFDLPGHGHSSGPEAAIDSFDQYVQAVDDFLAALRLRLTGPMSMLGFSLGGAIAMQMFARDPALFEKVILAAPLVHWTLYEQSKNTYKVYSQFTDRIRRFHQKNSSDKAYLTFNRTQDYLHCQSISLSWVKALFDWNERIEAMRPCEAPLLVLQGDKDRTVEWRYNLKLIGKTFPNAQIDIIDGARHELFNEAPPLRNQALKKAAAFFNPQQCDVNA